MEAVLIITICILGIFLLWIIAIKDIVQSTFIQPNNQILFLLLVVFMPVIGSLTYFVIGSRFKINERKS